MRIDKDLWDETMQRKDYIEGYHGSTPSNTTAVEEVLRVGNRMLAQAEAKMKRAREESRRRAEEAQDRGCSRSDRG